MFNTLDHDGGDGGYAAGIRRHGDAGGEEGVRSTPLHRHHHHQQQRQQGKKQSQFATKERGENEDRGHEAKGTSPRCLESRTSPVGNQDPTR